MIQHRGLPMCLNEMMLFHVISPMPQPKLRSLESSQIHDHLHMRDYKIKFMDSWIANLAFTSWINMWGIQLCGNSSCGKASQHKHVAALRLSIPDFGVFAIPVVLPFQACAMWANTRNNDWTDSGSCEQTGELWQRGERFPKLSTNQCRKHLINDNQSHKSHRHTRRTQLIKSKPSSPLSLWTKQFGCQHLHQSSCRTMPMSSALPWQNLDAS